MELLIGLSGEVLCHDSIGLLILYLASSFYRWYEVTLFWYCLINDQILFMSCVLAGDISTSISTLLHTLKQLILDFDSLSLLDR